MNKMIVSMTVGIVLFAGYSFGRPKAENSPSASAHITAQEMATSEEAIRHKHAQPSHWRSMVLR